MNRASTGKTQTENKRTDGKLDIKDHNLKNANREAMKQALVNTDWDKILGDENNVEQANQIFATALIQAAEVAKVPKYNVDIKKAKPNIKLNRLEQSRNKISRQLETNSIYLRGKDRENKQTNKVCQHKQRNSVLTREC